MRTKALILAALPGTFRGPRVPVSDGRVWGLFGSSECEGRVEITEGSSTRTIPFTNGMEVEGADYVRVELEIPGDTPVSIEATCSE